MAVQTTSELTGPSVYMFLSPKTPLLAIVAAATVLGQMMLMCVFLWASMDPDVNPDGDFANQYEAVCDSAAGPPTCSEMKQIGILGTFGSLVMVFLTEGPSLINGARLLKRGQLGPGLAMVVTGLVGAVVTLQYLQATVHGDTAAIKDAVVVLMVNVIDEQVYSNLSAVAPKYAKENQDLLDSDDVTG